MKKILSLAVFMSVWWMTGCQTPEQRTLNLDRYLQQFIGQTSEQIEAQINLPALGYQLQGTAQHTPHSLSYTIIRPVVVPIPSGQRSIDAGGALTGPPVGALGANSYETRLYCQISFLLENNRATNVQYTGRAC